jgi:uncharacterized protein YbaR (Trm112 family)
VSAVVEVAMDWRPLVICPVCHGDLTLGSAAVCNDCGRSYAIDNGVPMLLPDGVAPTALRPETQTRLTALPEPLRKLAYRVRPYLAPTMAYQSPAKRALVPNFVNSVHGPIVNVGSGSRRYGEHVLNLDIEATEFVDVGGVAEHLPFGDGVFDGALLQAVLEHVEDGHATIRELFRVLRAGGAAYIEIPFMQGYHGSPSDYRRFTELGLRRELESAGFVVEGTGVCVGPGSGAASVLSEYLALLFSFGPRGYRIARLVTRWLAWPLKRSDRWLDRHPMGFIVASGVWARAVKPE